MDADTVARLIADVASGRTGVEEAVRALQRLPFTDLGFARVDHHRALRQSMAEAVYAPGKTPAQCAEIVAELLAVDSAVPVLLTRADAVQAEAVLRAHPGACVTRASADTHSLSTLSWRHASERDFRVLVVTAGTADVPVARECEATLTAFGFRPRIVADCGVAGVHRLLDLTDDLLDADAIVVIAGMEGALASLVAGIAGAPVIAVPTSTGYGAGLDGITALLAMHASCAAGLSVVGIDNGFGAASAVARIASTALRTTAVTPEAVLP